MDQSSRCVLDKRSITTQRSKAMTETLPAKPLTTSSSISLPTSPSSLSEADLAKRINDAIESMASAFRNSARRAIEVGELLNEAKDRVKHGNFEEWLRTHCKLSFSTARRYMYFADHRAEIEAALNGKTVSVTDLSLSAAKRLIAPHPKSSGPASKSDKSTGKGTENVDVDPADNPLSAIHELEDKLLAELKTLKRDNHAKAKEAATNIIRRLEDADLVA
jgi:hypothetical protein